MSDEMCRLDVRLVRLGLADSRTKAKALVAGGWVTVNGHPVSKASLTVAPEDQIECTAPAQRYVGRGGYKLEKVLDSGLLSPAGLVCMDVGASTGGFTDCLLQHGAAHVFAVDVGHDQLHPRLRENSRVTLLEGTDIRSEALRRAVPAGSVALACVDVSFVSLAVVLPAVLSYLQPTAALVCLIKPQFEAGRIGVGKRGVVKDPRVHIRVLEEKLALFEEWRLGVETLTHSPITGGDGNVEYLALLRRGGVSWPVDVAAVVRTAHAALKNDE